MDACSKQQSLRNSASSPDEQAVTTGVSSGAVLKRINRKLAHQNEVVRTLRGLRSWTDLGDHFIVDRFTGNLVAGHVPLEQLGRQLGVLRASEVVIPEAGRRGIDNAIGIAKL